MLGLLEKLEGGCTDVGLSVMERMAESLVEFGTVDAKPKIMGRSMIMMMKPKPKS